jgi:hypothetical protein
MKLFEFFGKTVLDLNGEKKEDQLSEKHKPSDQELADEVYWFILDHDRLHKECFMPIAREIYVGHKKKGFDKGKYTKKWMPMVNKGCLEFYKNKKMSGDPADIFTKEMRRDLCHRLSEQNYEDIVKGEYRLGD